MTKSKIFRDSKKEDTDLKNLKDRVKKDEPKSKTPTRVVPAS